MIDALLTGKLYKAAEARTTKSGKTFVTTKLTVADADQQRQFVNLICFRPDACNALLALGEGDAVAVAGSLKASTWTDRNGEAKVSYDVTAEQVLTTYGLAKKRKASQPSDQPEQQGRAPAPADDDWIDAGQPLDF